MLDDDYAPAEFPGFADPTIPASVTFAHEFNHLLQQNYDSFQDVWMFESTAVWAEEKVYPEIDDYLNYVRVFAAFPGAPLTKAYPPDKRKSLKIYGSAVWNHWLDTGGGHYGVDVDPSRLGGLGPDEAADFSIASYERAIAGAGGAQLRARVRLVRRRDRRVAHRARQLPRPRPVSGRQAQAIPAPRRPRRLLAPAHGVPPVLDQARAHRPQARPAPQRRRRGARRASRSSPVTATRSAAG